VKLGGQVFMTNLTSSHEHSIKSPIDLERRRQIDKMLLVSVR
jgi:hypothetical protein